MASLITLRGTKLTGMFLGLLMLDFEIFQIVGPQIQACKGTSFWLFSILYLVFIFWSQSIVIWWRAEVWQTVLFGPILGSIKRMFAVWISLKDIDQLEFVTWIIHTSSLSFSFPFPPSLYIVFSFFFRCSCCDFV